MSIRLFPIISNPVTFGLKKQNKSHLGSSMFGLSFF